MSSNQNRDRRLKSVGTTDSDSMTSNVTNFEARTLTASGVIRPEDVDRLAQAPALDQVIERLRRQR